MFDPEAEGFAWPSESIIQNSSGSSMTIRPAALLSAGYARACDEREKECYRLYHSPLGPLTELEVRYWQAGGAAEVAGTLARIYEFLDQRSEGVTLQDIVSALEDSDPIIRLQVTLRWLVTGGYLLLDTVTLTLRKPNA